MPTGQQPPFNPDASDEGLLVFAQSTACRRKVWSEAYESATAGVYFSSHIEQDMINVFWPVQLQQYLAVIYVTPHYSKNLARVNYSVQGHPKHHQKGCLI